MAIGLTGRAPAGDGVGSTVAISQRVALGVKVGIEAQRRKGSFLASGWGWMQAVEPDGDEDAMPLGSLSHCSFR